MAAQETERSHAQWVRDILQAELHELELAAVRSRATERARDAFEVGLWVGAVLAGAVGLGYGYALGVKSKMTAPTAGKDTR